MRTVVILTAAIVASIAACSGSETVAVTPTPPNPPSGAAPVASVAVSIPSSSLLVGQSAAATATLRDAAGTLLSGRTISWTSASSAVASVSSSGMVTAVAAGSAAIRATSEGVTGETTVAVSAPAPAPVSTVSVVLSPTSVVAGQAVQATATLRDAGGSVLTGRSITWQSSNSAVATVASSGAVSTSAAGSATITATSEGKSGSATLTVTASSPTASCASPPPAWIFCDDFEQDRTARYFEYDQASGSFVRASGVGRNGSTGMRARFAAGQVSAGSLKIAFGRTPSSTFRPVDAGTNDYREIYWRVFVRRQAGWIGGGGDKLTRATVFARADWSQAMIAHVWSGSSPNENYLVADPARGTDASGTLVTVGYNDFAHLTWLGGTRGNTSLFDSAHENQWICVEAHVRLNDAGQSNGLMDVWVNGASEVQRTGLNFLGSFSDYGLNAVFLENYWNAGAPQAQERYFDDFVVSTARVGCA